MKEEIIKFETAKIAKEKGFDLITSNNFRLWYKEVQERCSWQRNFNNGINDSTNEEFFSAPTQSLLQRWLREEHDIQIDITSKPAAFQIDYDRYHLITSYEGKRGTANGYYETYELALEKGIFEALKLIKI